MKRLISLLAALCLVCAPALSGIAEGGTPRMITTTYQAALSPLLSYDVVYDEDVFRADSGTYSHTLARMSLAMALAAFRPASLEADQGENITRFLTDAGMENLRLDQYAVGMDENTIGTAMGVKTVGTGSGAFHLVAVAVCGGRYGNEWLSNFKVGNPGDSTALLHHQGFFEASQKVIQRVMEYIDDLDGTVKIWITGYSRGAAVSNLSAAMLVQLQCVEPGNMFAYSFATPANTMDEEAHENDYRGIYSITGTFDAVPQVPLALWGFTRYGRTLTLPSAESDSDYKLFCQRASDWSEEHLGIPFYYSTFVNYTVEKILDTFCAVMPTAQDYVEKLQRKLMELWREKGNMLAVIGLISDIYTETTGNEDSWALSSLLEESAWQGLLQWAGQGELDVSNTHSLAENLGREHFPDCYISLLMGNGEEIYDENRGYCRIAVMNEMNLSVEMIPDDPGTRKYPHMDVNADGASSDLWPVITFTGGHIVTLPLDRAYLLSVTGAKDDVETLILQFWTAKDAVKTEKLVYMSIEEDNQQWYCALLPAAEMNLDELVFQHGNRTVDMESTSGIYKSAMLDLLFISESAGNRLQTTVWILGAAVLLLSVTLILSAVWAFRGRTRRASVVLVLLLGVLFILVQLSHEFLPARGGFLAVFKGLAATTVLMECLLCTLQNKRLRNYLMLAGFVCYIVNDVLINFNLQWGMIASLAGNLFFIAAFSSERKKLSAAGLWAGAAAFVFGMTVLLLYRNAESVMAYFVEMAAFLAVLCVLVASAFGRGRLFRTGAVMLFLSDVFVFYNLLSGETWWSYIISLGTYYAAMVLLALGTKDGEQLPRISARGQKKIDRRRAKKTAAEGQA